jgi:hypothetical protein
VNVLLKWKRFAGRGDQIVVGTMSLIVAVRVVELLPNGLFSFLPFFLSGALAGVAAGAARSSAPAEVRTQGHDAEWEERGRTRSRPRRPHVVDMAGAAVRLSPRA